MRRALIAAILVLLTPRQASAVAAGVSGTASLIPGLGQVANGDALEGAGWFAGVLVLFTSGSPFARQIGFDLWMYNMYDAYRDAHPADGRITQHSLIANYVAAFNPLNVIDPIGAPIVGYGALAGASGGYPALNKVAGPVGYAFVGMGEEALFRGFLFPAFSDVFGGRFAGAIVSSAVFSVAHVSGGSANLASGALIQRFIGGMLFAWQADRNKYDLRKNIFAHTWYDVFVDSGGKISGGMIRSEVARF